MHKMHDAERCKAAAQHAKAAAAAASLSRQEEGGKEGVLPKRMKSGSGHHRPEPCGPSNGCHKLWQRRPDFFALLRSPPSAIDVRDSL